MPDMTIVDLNKNGRESIRISIREFKGYISADVRTYAVNTAGETVPTKQGVSIRPTLLRPVIDALLQAESLLVADGTLQPRRVN